MADCSWQSMERFADGQRVRVSYPGHPMEGEAGTVVRLLRRDIGAWIEMDRELPLDLLTFPRGNPRDRHTLLYPHECVPADEAPNDAT